MVYKEFQDLKLSALGMGCMRLPVVNGDDAQVDQAVTEAMADYAMSHGVNYYDTAWGYHDGESERAVGKILKSYPRESFYLATKFPGYDLSNMNKVEEIFEAQLKKCGVEYFDFYLFHNLCEMNIDAYLDDEKYGIYTYLKKQKAAGRISARQPRGHSPLSGSVRKGYGILSASDKLSRLDLSKREREDGFAGRMEHSHMGNGTPSRRKAGRFVGGGYRPIESAPSKRGDSRVGVPLFTDAALRKNDSVGNVRSRAG